MLSKRRQAKLAQLLQGQEEIPHKSLPGIMSETYVNKDIAEKTFDNDGFSDTDSLKGVMEVAN